MLHSTLVHTKSTNMPHGICRRTEDHKERDRRTERSADRRREPERSALGPSHGRERGVRDRERDRDPRAPGRHDDVKGRRPDAGREADIRARRYEADRDRSFRGLSRQALPQHLPRPTLQPLLVAVGLCHLPMSCVILLVMCQLREDHTVTSDSGDELELCAGIVSWAVILINRGEQTEIGLGNTIATAGMTETGVETETGAETQGMTGGMTGDTGSQGLGRQKRSW